MRNESMRNEKLESVFYGLLFGVLLYLLLYVGFKADNDNYNRNLETSYNMTCTVTQLYGNTVIVTDAVGNDWEFTKKDNEFNLGDVLDIPFNDNMTDNVYDDIMLVNRIKVVE